MKRFILAFLLILAGILIALEPADAHHQGDFFPGIPRSSFALANRMEAFGVWNWSYEQRCAEGDIRLDVAGAMDDTAARYQVPHVQVSLGLNYTTVQNNVSTCGTDFTARCGGGFAVACVGADSPGYPRNCDAYYNGPYLATFAQLASRKSVVKHELQHCESMRAEGYNDVDWNCNPVPPATFTDTIMGCGPQHPNDYTARDDWDWFIVHVPPSLPSYYGLYGVDGHAYVYYCNTSVNANRVFLYYDAGHGLVWSGERLNVTPVGCLNHEVPLGVCLWAKQTNAYADLLYGTEIKLGCS